MSLVGLPLLPGLLFLLLSKSPMAPPPPVMFRGDPAHRRRGGNPVRRPGRGALAGADGRRRPLQSRRHRHAGLRGKRRRESLLPYRRGNLAAGAAAL